MPQRPATSDSSSVSGQRSAAAAPSKPGAAPLSAIEPVLSPIERISATSSAVRGGSPGTAASSARLSSIGRACGPGSWISVGATQRTGSTREAVWDALAAVRDAGLTARLGVAPGPANGFTLDLLDCFERFGDAIDWAMIILNPLEPWPGELVLDAARHHDVELITRVVDYGGLFHDDVLPGHAFPRHDHRGFRPPGWVERGRVKLDAMRPIAARHDLSLLQLACAWNLAHPAVRCVAPTLIQEEGTGARPVEAKREELAALPPVSPLTADEVAEIRAIGDNTGSMALKGAAPDHEGEPRPDRWPLTPELEELAARWGIEPARDLVPA